LSYASRVEIVVRSEGSRRIRRGAVYGPRRAGVNRGSVLFFVFSKS